MSDSEPNFDNERVGRLKDGGLEGDFRPEMFSTAVYDCPSVPRIFSPATLTADSIYARYTRFGKTGEPSAGRMSVPSKVQLMNE